MKTVNEDQNEKQCVFRRDGSLRAVSSGSTLITKQSVDIYRADRAERVTKQNSENPPNIVYPYILFHYILRENIGIHIT